MSGESLRVSCTNCSAAMRVPAKAAGRKFKCPKCEAVFRVPLPEPVEPAAESEFDDDLLSGLGSGAAVATQPTATAERLQVLAAAKSLTAVTEAPKARTAAKTTRKTDWGPLVVNFFGCYTNRSLPSYLFCAALIGGIALSAAGFAEFRLRSKTKPDPQSITCANLTAQGPGDNYHVILTDFVMLPYYVYETRFSKWSGAWVPAISHEALAKKLSEKLNVPVKDLDTVAEERREEVLNNLRSQDFDFKVIISFPEADSTEYVDAQAELDTIQGTIFESLSSIADERRQLLRHGYPGVKLEDCYLLVAGREPKSQATANLMAFGGVGLARASLGMAFVRAKSLT